MKQPLIIGGDGDVDGGGDDGTSTGDDDDSIRLHDSDKYSGASGGEHSSDDDGHKYKDFPVDYEQDGNAHYAAKRRSSWRILRTDCMRLRIALMRTR